MGSIPEFEDLLKRCQVHLEDCQSMSKHLDTLPDSDFKRALAAMESARKSEALAREALNRERAKLN